MLTWNRERSIRTGQTVSPRSLSRKTNRRWTPSLEALEPLCLLAGTSTLTVGVSPCNANELYSAPQRPSIRPVARQVDFG